MMIPDNWKADAVIFLIGVLFIVGGIVGNKVADRRARHLARQARGNKTLIDLREVQCSTWPVF